MQIPLFPLHTVLAPGIAIPLHIFEERYRAMVRRCLEGSMPFGVVLIREGSEVAPRDGGTQELAIAAVGTFAEIREANRYADGRWDLLAVGTSRFLVREVHADREPYLVADVDPYPDAPGRPGAVEALAGRVTRRFVDYLRLLQPRDGETAEPVDVQMEVEIDEHVADEGAAEAASEGAYEGDHEGAHEGAYEGAYEGEREPPGADRDPLAGRDPGSDRDPAVGGSFGTDGAPGLGGAPGVGGSFGEPATTGPALAGPVGGPDEGDDHEAARTSLRIPDDPSALSFLLTGIVQVEPDRKQALLEAASAEERLRDLDDLLDRELALLGRRLAPFAVDRRVLAGSAN